jgi:hypothetical protein
MTPENFTYWLQGFLEISKATGINDIQLQEIKNHLKLTLDNKNDLYPVSRKPYLASEIITHPIAITC